MPDDDPVRCRVHRTRMVQVCDEWTCPTCYREALEREPQHHKLRQSTPLLTYSCCGAAILFRPSDHHKCLPA